MTPPSMKVVLAMESESTNRERPPPSLPWLAMSRQIAAAATLVALLLSACGSTTPTSLDVSSRSGYAVIVEDTGTELSVGFSTDRDAAAGQPYEVTDAVWRVGGGPWIEPPVTRLRKGPRGGVGGPAGRGCAGCPDGAPRRGSGGGWGGLRAGSDWHSRR